MCFVGFIALCLPALARSVAEQHRLDAALVSAVNNSELARVRNLLKQGANPNVRDGNGDPLLFDALDTGSALLFKCLLDHGANPNARSEYGMSILAAASYTGWTEAGYHPFEDVKLLVSKGADVNARDRDGATPIVTAASTNSIYTLKFLIAQGARIGDADNHGQTALMDACYAEGEASYYCPETAMALIMKGADVNARDKDGNTALMWLARNDSEDADLLRIVRALLAHGSKINFRNRFGSTALGMAKANHLNNLARLLKHAGGHE